MEPKEFRRALEARDSDIEFGAPVNEFELERFEALLGKPMDPYFRKLYSEFNGYGHDNNTHIDLWSLDEIAEDLRSSVALDDGRFLAFADFLAGSEMLMANLHDSNSRVFFQSEKRVIASNVPELLAGLVSGKFDF
jgi:hypothetical protein